MVDRSDPATEQEPDRSGDGQPASNTSRRQFLASAVAVGTTSGLAGCSNLVPGGLSGSAAATPVVLTQRAQERLGLPQAAVTENTRTVTAGGREVDLTQYLTVYSRTKTSEAPLPVTFEVPDIAARRVGIAAVPSGGLVGEQFNPIASQPIGELLVSDAGRTFLQETGVVEATDFDWRQPPTQVGTDDIGLLGGSTAVETYLGVAIGDDEPRTLLMHLARTDREDDVVLVGRVAWRRTPEQALDREGSCPDDGCQVLSKRLGQYVSGLQDWFGGVTTCPELARNTGGDIGQLCGGGSSDADPIPVFSVTNARLVQDVEQTDVAGTGTPTQIYHQERGLDLVRGEETAVVFEFDTIKYLNGMQQPLKIDVFSGDASSNSRYEREGTITLTKRDLQKVQTNLKNPSKGTHTIALLHEISTDGDANVNPVFDLETGRAKLSPQRLTSYSRAGVSTTITLSSSQQIRDLEPLKVGFVPLKDAPPWTKPKLSSGDRYGTANGTPRDAARSFRSALEYLQRVYPGEVVGYLHKKPCPGRVAWRGDLNRAKKVLNNIATGGALSASNFPNGGTFDADDSNRSQLIQDIKSNGFDVSVAICSGVARNNSNAGSYFSFHGKDWSGVFAGAGRAVASHGARPAGNDQGTSVTVAQEIGHYFQQDYLDPANAGRQPDYQHPMAQRRDLGNIFQKTAGNRPIDKDHARNRNSSHDGIPASNPDEPGVASIGYDLEEGFNNTQHFVDSNGNFNVDGPGWGSTTNASISTVPSYMSYTPNDAQAWADARIHQQLIDRGRGRKGWSASGTAGDGSAGFLVSGKGTRQPDGSIAYETVWTLQGSREYVHREDNPVLVELLDPDGAVLEQARVPLKSRASHASGEAPEVPAFTLPFDEAGVEIRTTHDGTGASMNPIVRGLRDAIQRVPPAGFSGNHERARSTLNRTLDEVASLMTEGAYADAAGVLDGQFRDRLTAAMVEYENDLDQRTPGAMVALLDRMVLRVDGVA
jgi:hypothetical protein